MQQISMPITEVMPAEIVRERSFGGAIELAVKVAGLEPKQIQSDLKLDKAQFSRWISGQEGVNWPKLQALMDHCGNDVPLLWMVNARGYDLHAMRKLESETERELRETKEENKALRRALVGAIK